MLIGIQLAPWRCAAIIIGLLIDRSIGEGNIGCLFAHSLCSEQTEWCFDDFAFGECLPQYRQLPPQNPIREPLSEEQTAILAVALEELSAAGLTWEHPIVQCRMQGMLYALRTNTPDNSDVCNPLIAANLDTIDDTQPFQDPLAFVQFAPQSDTFADEVYFPPPKKAFDDRIFAQHNVFAARQPMTANDERVLVRRMPNTNANPNADDEEWLSRDDIVPSVSGGNSYLLDRKVEQNAKDLKNRVELRRMFAEYEAGNLKPPIYVKDDVYFEPDDDVDASDRMQIAGEIERNEMEEPLASWRRANKRTGSFFKERQRMLDDNDVFDDTFAEISDRPIVVDNSRRQHAYGVEVPRETVAAHDPMNDIRREFLRDTVQPAVVHTRRPNLAQIGRQNAVDVEDEEPGEVGEFSVRPQKKLDGDVVPETGGVYTEGGYVYVPENDAHEDEVVATKLQARTLLEDMLGFTRHERLDVKKPGPPAGPPPSLQTLHPSPALGIAKLDLIEANTREILPENFESDIGPKVKKVIPVGGHGEDDLHAPHSVDDDYTHVILKNQIDSWKDGERIVQNLAEMLKMQNYLTHPRVDRHEVSFRVQPNPEKKTATDIARSINDNRFKNNLSRRLGITVLHAGVGDKTKEPTLSSVLASHVGAAEEAPNGTYVMIYMFVGAGAAAVVVIVLTMFLIKKHDRKRDKLGGLQGGLSAAESCSKDYQELCRARMAGKGGSNDSAGSGGKIASLSKESDARPPSSRSSTSSWCEEPALSNMDISTGHMVLSYMEDHLRNKGRLQREWEGLCRYEAEPNSRESALEKQCVPLNRPGAPLPFDHSRLVLNHLLNAEGMDYVNASIITDHDPRAPAYVAAQGPMPTTITHFWQTVWEQGAVVIVALCRLQENGEEACARYWPEEGSNVYHIYEVHLVSEHNWCDDYLVRSFYLKNLKSGETRTVTQFHFLSWPQNGVPNSAKALLEFRRKVNKSYRGRSCPIVVHSSHGAGRTGAYILLDLVLARMNKGAREIDIAATLEHLRDQRSGLVATRQQFEFVLMAVAEEVHAILKALPANTQNDKRDQLDKQSIKEQDGESGAIVQPIVAKKSPEKATVK